MTTPASIIDPDKVCVRRPTPGADWPTVEVDLPAEVIADMQRLVDSPQFPEYQSIADVVQDSMVHELGDVYLRATDPEVRARLGGFLRGVAAEERSP